MRKSMFLWTLLCVLKMQAFAGSVNVSTAQTVALNFFKTLAVNLSAHNTPTASLVYTKNDTDGIIDFYVFDFSPVSGFVIVSASDNTSPVLGYSTETNFNSNVPDIGMKGWIDYASGSVHHAIQKNASASQRTASLWSNYKEGTSAAELRSTTVSPMLTTTWNQSPYYNALCPYDNTNKGQCVTGCVATAMAQIMKYWSYPAKGTGSYTYTDSISKGYSENIGVLSANFGNTNYQWASMPASISSTNTPIATLMYHVGVSLAMDYGAYGSSAYLYYYQHPCVYNALKTYFGYDSLTLQSVSLSADTAGWLSMIENELTAGRPVLYSGYETSGGGHAWVCDGFDANNMLHMNWGWAGEDNGYFAVSNLDPSPDNFTWDQSAVIGIEPPTAPVASFSANATTTCNGVVQFTDNSAGGPTSWLWNFGDGSTSTLQNPVHQYVINGTYSVSLAISNTYGSNNKPISNYITVSRPVGPAVNNAFNCTASSFSLSASTTNPVSWYDTSGNLVSSANPFVTPVLSKTTNYKVEEWNIDTAQKTTYSLGAPANTTGYYYYYFNSNNYFQEKFNVTVPVTLQSVLIYSGITASRTIVCTNSSNTVLASKTFSAQQGSQRVTLNFNLPAGGPYYLGFTNDSLMEFGQQTASFPYNDAQQLLQIVGNNLNTNWYPYFYDWVVSEPSYCLSEQATVTASIGAAAGSISASGSTNFCTGGSVILTAITGSTYKWSSGQTSQAIVATATGSYKVTVTNSGTCSATAGPVSVNASAAPAATISSNGAITFCKGGTVTLTAAAGTGYSYKWSTVYYYTGDKCIFKWQLYRNYYK